MRLNLPFLTFYWYRYDSIIIIYDNRVILIIILSKIKQNYGKNNNSFMMDLIKYPEFNRILNIFDNKYYLCGFI